MGLCTQCIWEQFSQQVRNFILARVSDPEDADDILQNVFLKIHQHIHTLRDDERLLPWLYQIARNTITDHYRKQRPDAALPDEDLIAAPDTQPSAADDFATGLKDFISALPQKYSQALMLTEFENLSQKDLARRLAISHSGAKSRVQRGRALLKQNLEDCCQFEFDRYGHLVDYIPRSANCCDHCGQTASC